MPGPLRRARRAVAAALVSLPLVSVPMMAPAVAAVPAGGAVTVDAREHGVPLGIKAFRQEARQHATKASSKQSAGVVLIDEVLDYGEGEAAGTGLVISHDGLVVTNHHVVTDATSIKVKVPGKDRTYRASVLGYDTHHDVAVLQLQGARHLHLVATHRRIDIGESIRAVGNAEGRGRLTAAPGKVLKRRVTINVTDDAGGRERMIGLIKDSADVVPGDSGGALLDSHDRAVGMNVAATAGSKNVVGFAIPISRVKRIADQIIQGRAGPDVTIGSRAALGVLLDSRRPTPYVADVIPGGPAAQVGLAAGDTIVSLGSAHVRTDSQLAASLASYRPGQQVEVGWTDPRSGPHAATVILGAGPVG